MISTLLLSRRSSSRWSAGCCSSRSPTAWSRARRDVVGRPRPPGRPPRRSAGCRPPTATTSTPAPSSPSWSSTLVSRGSVQGYEIVLTGPIAGSGSGVAAGAGTSSTPGVLSRQHPGARCAARSSRARATRRRTPTRRSATPPAPAGPRCPAWSTGSQVDAAGRRRHLRALLPVPADRGAAAPSRSCAARCCHRRRAAAAAGRRR